VSGGLGTTFFTTKIAIGESDTSGFKAAVSPTLEILSGAEMEAAPAGQNRVQWGLPVSVHFDHGNARIYGGSGYFSPGIWYGGAGLARPLGDRFGLSMSFSTAWASSSPVRLAGVTASRRSEFSGSLSYDLRPNVAIFGSLGHTVGVAAENGAGATFGLGLSLSAAPSMFAN
jgi:hypothetical protein